MGRVSWGSDPDQDRGGSKGRSHHEEEDEPEDVLTAAAQGIAKANAGPMFVDAAAMKEKLRQNMCKPEYNVANFYHKVGLFRYLATHKIFEGATLSVIAFNALWISIDTDHNQAEVLLGAQPVFQFMEHFFCAYFSFEWFCRWMAFKRKRNGLKDAWFVFDTGMVVMMVLETWVMTIVMLATGSGGGGGMGNASILRLARLLRLSRMARMARLLRAMPELMILIKGMIAAMRSVFFTLMLLAILIYIFGIMFTQLMVDTIIGETHFKTVPLSMHTLLIDGTLLDGIGTVVRELGYESIIYSGIFYMFVLLSALTVMNMLIGVLCEVVSAVAATEKEEITVAFVKDKLQEVMQTSGLDEDGDNEISKSEFVKILQIPDACRCLQEVGVDVVGLVDLTDFLFEGDGDNEDEGGEQNLTFADFMEVVLQLRGSNSATVKDIVDLRKFVRKETKCLEEKLERFVDTGSMRRKTPNQVRPSNNNGAETSMDLSPSLRRGATDACVGRVVTRDPPRGTPGLNGDGESSPTLLGREVHSSDHLDDRVETRLCTQAGKLQAMVSAGHMELLKLLESIHEYKRGRENSPPKMPGTPDTTDTKSLVYMSEGNGMSNGTPGSSPAKSPAKKVQVDLEDLHLQMMRLQEALGAGLASLGVARERLTKAGFA